MKTIMVAGIKGGVGKSTIADELAFRFERDNFKVRFYDLDNQGGTIHQTSSDKDDADIRIVDMPGALRNTIKDCLEESDLCVIPTRPSSRDIPPLEQFVDIATRYDTKTYIILNAQNRFSPSRDFESWFVTNHPELPYDKLPETVQFIKAAAKGTSIEKIDAKCPGNLAMEKIYRTCRLALDI